MEKLQEVNEVAETKIDSDAAAADRAAGLTVEEIAAKYGAHKSNIYRALKPQAQRPRRSPAASAATPTKAAANGTNGNGHAAPTELQAIEKIVNERWQHLALPDRLRILLQA